jgi:hypothetical protein
MFKEFINQAVADTKGYGYYIEEKLPTRFIEDCYENIVILPPAD